MCKYEVWTAIMVERFDGKEFAQDVLETRRTDKRVAQEDVGLFKLFGRTAWIVEVGSC